MNIENDGVGNDELSVGSAEEEQEGHTDAAVAEGLTPISRATLDMLKDDDDNIDALHDDLDGTKDQDFEPSDAQISMATNKEFTATLHIVLSWVMHFISWTEQRCPCTMNIRRYIFAHSGLQCL